jgi:hypothetical protein
MHRDFTSWNSPKRYVRFAEGDSISLDWFIFPDDGDDKILHDDVPNNLSDESGYWLSFEAWLPDGQDGKEMHATMHYYIYIARYAEKYPMHEMKQDQRYLSLFSFPLKLSNP